MKIIDVKDIDLNDRCIILPNHIKRNEMLIIMNISGDIILRYITTDSIKYNLMVHYTNEIEYDITEEELPYQLKLPMMRIINEINEPNNVKIDNVKADKKYILYIKCGMFGICDI